MDLNNLIILFFIVIFGLFFYAYLIPATKKNYPKLLIDSELDKPQAYHEYPVSISGGLSIFLSFLITCVYFLFFKDQSFSVYFSFCTALFLIGFADDLKISMDAKIRLVLMSIFLIILIKYNDFYVEFTGIEFLNSWIASSEIFSLLFMSLCFLFIINGANLVDGYNGLLGIHSLIIILNLFFINFLNNNNDLAIFLLFQIIIIAIFVKYNFPKAKVFLGDSGSYFLGTFLSISIIETSIANPTISPFYFCILLFYLFFEVFFSFFRKIVFEKILPVYPDGKHLHMLFYKIMFKGNNNKLKSNYYVSLIINSVYLLMIIPAILMKEDGMFCKYYSVVLFAVYIIAYKMMSNKLKQN